LSQRVIEAMVVALSEQDQNRLIKHTTSNYAAYDAFLYGQQQYKNRDRESYDLTIDAYQRAIKLDPDFARAYGALAVIYTIGDLNRWNKLSLEESRDQSLQLAKKAVALDRNSPEAYWSLGFVHLFRKDFAEAEAAVLQSIRLSPNFADGYGLLAFIANWRGKANAAIQYINRAKALNPHYTFDYPLNLGMAFYTLGQYARAEEELKKALDRNATSLYSRLFLAASYVQLGRPEDGEWEVQQAIVQVPETTLSQLAQVLPYESRKFTNRLLADLSKAGLPR